MVTKVFSTTKAIAFENCKRALENVNCEIALEDFSNGIIEASKRGNIFSYGHKIIIRVNPNNSTGIQISISSNSVGLQVIDWGTNSENENEIMGIIINSLR